jgi:hypothetical protein
LDTLLGPSLHCNTSPHFTQQHFTTLIDTSLTFIYTSLTHLNFLSYERILILKYSHFLLEYCFSVLTSYWVCSNIVLSLVPVTTIKCVDSNLETWEAVVHMLTTNFFSTPLVQSLVKFAVWAVRWFYMMNLYIFCFVDFPKNGVRNNQM